MDFKKEKSNCLNSMPPSAGLPGLNYFTPRPSSLNSRRTILNSCRFLAVLFLVSLICDAVSTVSFMKDIGIEAELNPAVRVLSSTFGHTAGPFLGAVLKALAVMLICLRFRQYTAKILLSGSIIYLFAAFYNFWGVYIIHLPMMLL